MAESTNNRRSRIGFFAGVFDPIHDGHLEVARSAVENLGLEKLYLMTEELAWGDKTPVDIRHRRAMVDLCVAEDLKVEQLVLADKQFDISRTLTSLEAKFPSSELYFIFGADIFIKMNPDTWRGLSRLMKHYIVVFERKSITEKEISQHAEKLGIAIAILPSQHPQHSSTDVRMSPHAKSVWVPKKVAEYIDRQKLY